MFNKDLYDVAYYMFDKPRNPDIQFDDDDNLLPDSVGAFENFKENFIPELQLYIQSNYLDKKVAYDEVINELDALSDGLGQSMAVFIPEPSKIFDQDFIDEVMAIAA